MPALTGQTIAEAQGAVRALLDQVLVDSGLTSNEFVTLRVLTVRGPFPAAGGLAGFLAGQRQLDLGAAGAAALVEGLRARGLVAGEAITPEGATLFERVQERVAAATARLYESMDEDDLATAARVLTEVIARAERLTGAGS